jgi:putative endopeptidase
MYRCSMLILTLALAAAARAQEAPPPKPAAPAAPAVPDPADSAKPRAIPGFDVAAVDKSVNPCDDFYQYACGGWLAANPIPSDRPRWGRFDALNLRNQEALRAILERTSAPDPKRDPLDQKIGDFYGSCMDEAAIEKKGAAALQPQLELIAGIKTEAQLAKAVADLQTGGMGGLFNFGAMPDFKDASINMASVDQGGLSLPDRDYYLSDEPRFADIRKQYPGHVQKMLELLGQPAEAAAKDAATILQMETALARASLERVKRRDPQNQYHKITRADLAALAPRFDWKTYFTAAQAPVFDDLNVVWPDFFKGLNELLARPREDFKVYLRWHLVHSAARHLSSPFVNENFAFYGKILTGTPELRPRWKRCTDYTDEYLGEALGRRYVEATFGAEGKERVLGMVSKLRSALESDIHESSWMTDPTKKKALEKLAAVANKIGYPDTWRDYSSVKVVRGDLLGNAMRAGAFEWARDSAKIGKKVDPAEWHMTPSTVNAYYSPLENNINFPAGILQPPFFERSQDDAPNFGGIGAVIGHELTHGFDDKGRQFDAHGNLADWWTEADAKAFEDRAACFVDQYSSYVVAGTHLDGKLSLGENTADNGGLRLAYMALQGTQGKAKAAPRDGLTPEQRFFLGFGQVWCTNARDEYLKMILVDTHPPGRERVNGVVSNMPEFRQAFSCPAGAPMVREPGCRVW